MCQEHPKWKRVGSSIELTPKAPAACRGPHGWLHPDSHLSLSQQGFGFPWETQSSSFGSFPNPSRSKPWEEHCAERSTGHAAAGTMGFASMGSISTWISRQWMLFPHTDAILGTATGPRGAESHVWWQDLPIHCPSIPSPAWKRHQQGHG